MNLHVKNKNLNCSNSCNFNGNKQEIGLGVIYKDTEEAFGSRGDGVEGIEVAEFAKTSGIVIGSYKKYSITLPKNNHQTQNQN